MKVSLSNWMGRSMRQLGERLLVRSSLHGIWMDVGAHHGQMTLGYARHNPALTIFAVEPNPRAAVRLMGKSSNYHVLPFAITETDGCAEFHLNEFEMASSLLELDEEATRSWVGVSDHRVERTITVPTIRLDTLTDLLQIRRIDFLKVDTQGGDLAVLRSAGQRIRDVARITVEVSVAEPPLYKGAPSKTEVISFLEQSGFRLISVEKQTHGQEENLTFVRN